MKKICKLALLWALALCLLAGCGNVPAQPERQPLIEPSVEGEQAATPNVPVEPQQPAVQETVEDPTKGGTVEKDGTGEPDSGAEGEIFPPVGPDTTEEPVSPAEPQQSDTQEPPAPVPPEEQETGDQELTCTLEIRCDTILNNPDLLDPEKAELVPGDGVLFTAGEVVFYEGESVFQVLQRTMKQNKQHLEFAQSPLYDSSYIEGICNLYQFDCGSLSGWMYRVNDWYPNYGCSQYVVQDGDVIVWDFTCDLGADLGAENNGNNQ